MMSDEEQETDPTPFSEDDLNVLQDALEKARAAGVGITATEGGETAKAKIVNDPDDPYHYDGS